MGASERRVSPPRGPSLKKEMSAVPTVTSRTDDRVCRFYSSHVPRSCFIFAGCFDDFITALLAQADTTTPYMFANTACSVLNPTLQRGGCVS